MVMNDLQLSPCQALGTQSTEAAALLQHEEGWHWHCWLQLALQLGAQPGANATVNCDTPHTRTHGHPHSELEAPSLSGTCGYWVPIKVLSTQAEKTRTKSMLDLAKN